MFFPRVQTKLIALIFIIISLYFLTSRWHPSPELPKTFLSKLAGNDKDVTKNPPVAAHPPKRPTDEKPLPFSADLPEPEKDTPESAKASAKPELPSAPTSPSNTESPLTPDPAEKPSKPDTSTKPGRPVDSDSEDEAPSEEKDPKTSTTTPESSTSAAAQPKTSAILNPGAVESDVTLDARISFWREFEKILAESKPKCNPPKRKGKAEAQGFNLKKELQREDLMSMHKEDVQKMKSAHEKIVEALNKDTLELPYTSGTRGLVSTAGGRYLPVFVISLRMLRRHGTSLPMEVFLADEDEYEQEICEKVLPKLNAKCVVLSKILTAVPHETEISHYQYKVFAMLFSSFEDVLFLDSDAWPIRDAEQLFTSEPFPSYGMVTWPDFWASSASPLLYEISGQPVPRMDVRQSTESGELLLAKKTHSRSLLLATYYNYYGPKLYYPLFSQGAPGEGDKETFIAAATALNESFYQTSESVRPVGHTKQSNNQFAGTAMVQHDPIEDYRLTSQNLWRIKDASVAKAPRPFFLHCNFPRPNPIDVFTHKEHTKAKDGSWQRTMTNGEKMMTGFDYDVEKDLWEEVRWVSCELEHSFKSFQGSHDICKNATAYYEGMYDAKPTTLDDEEESHLENIKEKPKPDAKSAEVEEKPTGFKSTPPGPGK